MSISNDAKAEQAPANALASYLIFKVRMEPLRAMAGLLPEGITLLAGKIFHVTAVPKPGFPDDADLSAGLEASITVAKPSDADLARVILLVIDADRKVSVIPRERLRLGTDGQGQLTITFRMTNARMRVVPGLGEPANIPVVPAEAPAKASDFFKDVQSDVAADRGSDTGTDLATDTSTSTATTTDTSTATSTDTSTKTVTNTSTSTKTSTATMTNTATSTMTSTSTGVTPPVADAPVISDTSTSFEPPPPAEAPVASDTSTSFEPPPPAEAPVASDTSTSFEPPPMEEPPPATDTSTEFQKFQAMKFDTVN